MTSNAYAKAALILREGCVVIGAAVVGAVLRIYQLENQILIGDEWHAIHVALHSNGYAGILFTFGSGTHSIPEALYYKFLIDTVGLSEWNIHAPFLVAGIAMIIVIPVLVREIIGGYESNLLAWLLALSPLLTFYSRFARPYGIMTLIGFSAAVLFYRWWTTGKRGYAVWYVGASVFAAYLHVISLPFVVVGTYAYFFALILLDARGHRLHAMKRLLTAAVATGILLALLMGVPLFVSHGAITSKTGDLAIRCDALFRALWILTGSTNSVLVACGIAAAVGAGVFVKVVRSNDRRRFFIYLIVLSVMQILLVVFLRPVAGNAPHILARYLILVQPVLLLLMASGIRSLLRFVNRRMLLQVCFIALFLCAYFFTGPIPASIFRRSNAANLSLLVTMAYGKGYEEHVLSQVVKRIPAFYKSLAMYPPGTLTIAEAPYHFNGYHIFIYQAVHRQNVLMGFINGLCSQDRFDEVPYFAKNSKFKNFVFLGDSRLLRERGINFVVFHKRLIDEIRDTPEHQHQDVSPCIESYRSWFGEPAFEDRDIVVFSVKPENQYSFSSEATTSKERQ